MSGTILNDLERIIAAARNGQCGGSEFVEQLLKCDIYLPSGSEPTNLNALAPLFVTKQDSTFLVAATSLEEAKSFSEKAPYCLALPARDVIAMIDPSLGLVMNPGSSLGFEIVATGLSKIRLDFGLNRIDPNDK